MKDNNVGGPSIIFNRYHEKDETFIRNAEMSGKNLESGLTCRICQRDNIHDDWKATTLKSNGVVKWP